MENLQNGVTVLNHGKRVCRKVKNAVVKSVRVGSAVVGVLVTAELTSLGIKMLEQDAKALCSEMKDKKRK